LKKEKNKDKQETIRSQMSELKKAYENNVEQAYQNVDIKQMFVDRNEGLVQSRRVELQTQQKHNLNEFAKNFQQQRINHYQDAIRKDKNTKKQELEEELRKQIAKRVREESIVRFSLYFKTNPENQYGVVNTLHNKKYRYLIYNNRAEQAKI